MNAPPTRLAAILGAIVTVTMPPQTGRTQSTLVIAACANGAAPQLEPSMLRDGARVRFTARMSTSEPSCSHRRTTHGCFTTCRAHGLAHGPGGLLVHVHGDAIGCASGGLATARCAFSDDQSLTFSGVLRRDAAGWWLRATSACLP